ncbi:MAG TPA: VanZ family protein [Gemmatimonadales bacterium]|jgi:hypothetical protein
MNDHRGVWRAVVVSWVVVIAWLTLRSAPDQAARVAALPWYCISCGDSGSADIILNILLFAPLGLAARALGVRFGHMLMMVVPFTLGIELTQGLFLVGRDASLGDVLSNTTGAAIAWWSFRALTRMIRPTRSEGRRGAVAVLAILAAMFVATGIAFAPVGPGDGPWVGQVLHHWPNHDPFPGTIAGVTLNGVDVPNDPLRVTPQITDGPDLVINLTRTGDSSPVRAASLVRVVDADHTIRVAVSQIGSALVLEVALRGARWRFHAPAWRFDRIMDIPLRRPARFEFIWTRHGAQLIRTGPDATMNRTVTISAALDLGWIFVHPFTDTIGRRAWWWTVLWLGWWWGWLGWLSGAAGWRTVAVAGLASAGLLTIASIATGVAVGGIELAAAPVALLVAAAGAERLRGGAPALRRRTSSIN